MFTITSIFFLEVDCFIIIENMDLGKYVLHIEISAAASKYQLYFKSNCVPFIYLLTD
jgi:hypothetical protein